MKPVVIMMARVYVSESSKLSGKITEYLHKEAKVRGLSVFRAISGYGASGATHTLALLDISLDLPLVIEFFDNKEKVTTALQQISTWVKPGHIVFWEAQTTE